MEKEMVYSDGTVEDEILELVRKDGGLAGEELQDGAVFHNFTACRENLFNWYPFQKEASLLEVGAGMGALTGIFCQQCQKVVALEQSPKRAGIIAARYKEAENLEVISGDIFTHQFEEKFDYIILAGVLEYAAVGNGNEGIYGLMLRCLKELLKPEGKLLLAIENRFGLKYWCGASEDHTGIPFDGIAGYEKNGYTTRYHAEGVRTFSRSELAGMLQEAGLTEQRWYYPLPDYKFPMALFSDEKLPGESDIDSIKFTYPEESELIADERKLYKEVIKNKTFPFFANSFLVEAASCELEEYHVKYATFKRDYNEKYRIMTLLDSDDEYVKKPVSGQAAEHFWDSVHYQEELGTHGIKVVPLSMRNGTAVSKLQEYPRADVRFKDFLEQRRLRDCIRMLEVLRANIFRSSETVSEIAYEQTDIEKVLEIPKRSIDMGVILQSAYVDMTFQNSFFVKDELLFFDQEWKIPYLPVNFILYRALKYACSSERYAEDKTFFEHYLGISREETEIYDRYENKMLEGMMNEGNCRIFDPKMYHEGLLAIPCARKRYSELSNEKRQREEELNRVLHEQEDRIIELDQEILNKTGEKEKINQEFQGQENRIIALNQKILNMKQEEEEALAEIDGLQQKLAQKDKEILESNHLLKIEKKAAEETNQKLVVTSRKLAEVTQRLESANRELTETSRRLESANQELTETSRRLENTNQELTETSQRLESTNLELERTNRELAEANQEILNKKGHIELLLPPERELIAIKKSKMFKIMRFFCRILDVLLILPKFLIRQLAAFIRMMGHVNVAELKIAWGYVRNEGIIGAYRHLMRDYHQGDLKKIEVEVVEQKEEKPVENINDYEVLVLPAAENPEVSVVIPAYNQFAYTYYCIQSIIKNSGDVPYEVILADDCSTDLTVDICKVVKNLVVARTASNQLFLRNCNQAAVHARGKYILFLNNDTQVQENWLQPLIDLMEKDEQIGMTGSKLVYADGTLQEAGGIIWKDGSAWNYGRNDDAMKPEYNYVRDVDYISGAAIMIRSELWKQLGGFDEEFAPAYCEDSDLAFRVRRAGYRVVYQPLSVVVHFEGKSNGTDLNAGIKKYQVENSLKLKRRWKTELEKQYDNGINVFKARERSWDKKVILAIDHYVPQFDKDAGSKTTIQYLRMFVKKGYVVKFIGDNYFQHEPYTTILQQMGIEVLYGPWYAQHWQEWLMQNKDSIDFAYLNRPHITIKYIDFIRENTNIKCIYYGHDLHFLRLRREYELTGDGEKKKESKEWLEKELYIMRKADMNYYPSYVEEKEIHKVDPLIRVKAITAYVYETFREKIPNDFTKREGIVFVGGFGHPPNEDAVLWFAKEVYPLICRRLKIPFYIVGSYPTPEIEKLSSENIIVKGFVSEEELAQLYDTCRIVVVPLRYGAGVKGKVVEALYYGTPMVTTSVGAEGIEDIDTVVSIADDNHDFADAVISLYTDYGKLKAMQTASQRFVRTKFGVEAVWSTVKDDFV